MSIQSQIKKLLDDADRLEESVSSNAGPSSQEWVSPERREHYMGMAAKKRLEADKLKRSLKE